MTRRDRLHRAPLSDRADRSVPPLYICLRTLSRRRTRSVSFQSLCNCAVHVPESFRGGCSFGAGNDPVSPAAMQTLERCLLCIEGQRCNRLRPVCHLLSLNVWTDTLRLRRQRIGRRRLIVASQTAERMHLWQTSSSIVVDDCSRECQALLKAFWGRIFCTQPRSFRKPTCVSIIEAAHLNARRRQPVGHQPVRQLATPRHQFITT